MAYLYPHGDGSPPGPLPPEWVVYHLCRMLKKLPSEVMAEDAGAMEDFMECLAWEGKEQAARA